MFSARIHEARVLFAAARSAECLGMIAMEPSATSAVLRARCLLRLREPGGAIESLKLIRIADEPDHLKAEYHALRATAHHRCGETEKAEKYFEAARIVAERLGGAAVAELDNFGSAAAWSERDLPRAEGRALRALAVAPVPGDRYARPLSAIRAQALELLSLVAAAREDYPTQVRFLRSAWSAQSDAPEGERDHFVRASLLKNLSPLVWDLHLADEAAFLAEASTTIPWTAETALPRWTVHRALAWLAALEGDQINAFRSFRETIDLAPNTPCRIFSRLDRAYFAAEMNQQATFLEDRARAFEAAETLVPESLRGEEANVLLGLAEAHARENAEVARGWLRRFDRERAFPPGLLLVSSSDRRQTAWEWEAEAAVLAAEGNIEQAVRFRRLALQTWDQLAHRWRAARTALALAELTGTDEDAAQARRRADEFHASWLDRRARRLRSSDHGL